MGIYRGFSTYRTLTNPAQVLDFQNRDVYVERIADSNAMHLSYAHSNAHKYGHIAPFQTFILHVLLSRQSWAHRLVTSSSSSSALMMGLWCRAYIIHATTRMIAATMAGLTSVRMCVAVRVAGAARYTISSDMGVWGVRVVLRVLRAVEIVLTVGGVLDVDDTESDDVVDDETAIGDAEALAGTALLVVDETVEAGDGTGVSIVDAFRETVLVSDVVADVGLVDVTAVDPVDVATGLGVDASETKTAGGVVFLVPDPGSSDPEPS